MNYKFVYRVSYLNSDGDITLDSRFLNPESAYTWAKRLDKEGVRWIAYKKHESGEVEVSLTDLRKEAGSCLTSREKTVRGSKRR